MGVVRSSHWQGGLLLSGYQPSVGVRRKVWTSAVILPGSERYHPSPRARFASKACAAPMHRVAMALLLVRRAR